MHRPLAASRRDSLQALDYVNVFLANVRDGVLSSNLLRESLSLPQIMLIFGDDRLVSLRGK